MQKNYQDSLNDFNEFTIQIHSARMAAKQIVYKIKSCCSEKGANFISGPHTLTDKEKEDSALEAKINFMCFKDIYIKVSPAYFITDNIHYNTMLVNAILADNGELLASAILYKELHGAVDEKKLISFNTESERNEYVAKYFTRKLIASLSTHIPTVGEPEAFII